MYRISSRGQPTRGGPPAWELDEVLATHRRKKKLPSYEPFTAASDLLIRERRGAYGLVGRREGKKSTWKTQT